MGGAGPMLFSRDCRTSAMCCEGLGLYGFWPVALVYEEVGVITYDGHRFATLFRALSTTTRSTFILYTYYLFINVVAGPSVSPFSFCSVLGFLWYSHFHSHFFTTHVRITGPPISHFCLRMMFPTLEQALQQPHFSAATFYHTLTRIFYLQSYSPANHSPNLIYSSSTI